MRGQFLVQCCVRATSSASVPLLQLRLSPHSELRLLGVTTKQSDKLISPFQRGHLEPPGTSLVVFLLPLKCRCR